MIGSNLGIGRPTSLDWKRRTTERGVLTSGIKKHHNHCYVIMDVPPHPLLNLLEVRKSHFTLLSSFSKCSFHKSSGNSLLHETNACQPTTIVRNRKEYVALPGYKELMEPYVWWVAVDYVNSLLVGKMLP